MGSKSRADVSALRRPLLDKEKKEEMLAILIRNPEAYAACSTILTRAYLESYMGPGYGLIWSVVQDMYVKTGRLPFRASISTECARIIKKESYRWETEDRESVEKFLSIAFDPDGYEADVTTDENYYDLAISTCKEFVTESHLRFLREKLLKDNMVPIDPIKSLDEVRATIELSNAITGVDFDVPFPEDWLDRKKVKLFSTGCTILDYFMGGGWRAGEVFLFLGPFGSCKTTLVCHSVSELILTADANYVKAMANWESKGKKKKKPRKPIVFLFFTEGDKETYRCRILSHLAKIPWMRLLSIGSYDDLSDSTTPGDLPYVDCNNMGTAYEREEFPADYIGFKTERQRAIDAAKAANNHLQLIDCTNSEKGNVGKGGVAELAGVVRAYFRKFPDRKPLAFWLDHASALAARMSDGTDDDKTHIILNRIPLEFADNIAKPFRAPVAIMHQLSGESNKKGPTATLTHANAKGSTSIGEYVDYAVVTGKQNEINLCVFNVTKHRRTAPKPSCIVKIRGEFNLLVDVTERYVVMPGSHKIVSKEEMTAHAQVDRASGNTPVYAGTGDS